MSDGGKTFKVERTGISAAAPVAVMERSGLRRARRKALSIGWLVPTLYIVFLLLPIY